jgi:alpha-L-arabinofuranosidase
MRHGNLDHKKNSTIIALISLLALPVPGLVRAQATAATTINVTNQVLQSPVKRFGINLGATNYYDSGQMLKNLIVNNPGFEGEIAQSMINCGSGTAKSCTDSLLYGGWPTDFWKGGTYQFVYGTALGRSGTIAGYTAATSSTGGTWTFADSGTVPSKADYMIVRQTAPGNAVDGWNYITGSGGSSIATNTTDLPPATQGVQTIQLNGLATDGGVHLYANFDSTAGRTFVQLTGTYQLSFKAKGLGANGAGSIQVLLFRYIYPQTYYINQTINLPSDPNCASLGSGWYNCTITFDGTDTGSTVGTAQLEFDTVGASSLYLDDVSLMQTGTDPTNNTVFRDPVVNALEDFRPGVMRFWFNQLGESLDNLLQPQFGRQRSAYDPYISDVSYISYGLTEFLQLAQRVGADPWVVIPITLSNTEASNLIDYLAGSTSTVYGAKRAAAGQTAPWTSVFNTIHLEFGNEAWDTIFDGGNMTNGTAYGTRAQSVFASMRSNPAYKAASFDLIVNGWASDSKYSAGLNTSIQNAVSNNDSFTDAPYMMFTVNDPGTSGAALIENLFGSEFAEAEAFVTNSGTAEGIANGYILQQQREIAASNNPKPYITTEFNISPRNGSMTEAELTDISSSIGSGLAVADGMLQQLRAGVLTQNLFELAEYNYYTPNSNNVYLTANLFGATVDMGVTDLRRGQFLAVQMANNAINTANATMLTTVQTGANPTWNQAMVQQVQLNNVHYLQSFAFNTGNQYSLILFNVNRTTALPVTFAGDNVPAGTVQSQVLTSANITDNNETSSVFAPVSSTLASFNPSTPMSLPPYSMTVLTWTAPKISNVTVTNVTGTSATITWTTDVPSTGQVSYGTTTAYGSQSASTGASTTQSITITGLVPGQTYDFAVLATGAGATAGASAGNTASSANVAFTTSGGFTLSAPASVTLQQGQSGSTAVTVTKSAGFSGTVTLSVSGLPTGATDTIATTSTGDTLTISVPTTVAVATYPLTLTGTSGSVKVTTPLSLVVTQTQAITVDPCAVDYGTCTIPQGTTATVYYGAGGKYLQRTLTGTFTCSPATFGSDPNQGVLKSCYPVVSALPVAATASCAVDNGTCTVPPGSSAVVYYGANNTYVYKTLSGTVSCSTTTFGGDPLPGIVKSCYAVVTTLPPASTACAVDFGTCTTPAGTTANVYYGVNGIYLSKTITGGTFTCAPATFGGVDPVHGVLKSCYPVISVPPSTVKACAQDYGTCTIPSGSKTVYYGANSIYLNKTLSGKFTCLPSTFGGTDPVPKVVKSCLY